MSFFYYYFIFILFFLLLLFFFFEGMYVDVQWLGAPGGEEGTIEREWMRLNGRMDKEKEELNKKKILALVNEYNVFKRENVRHFMFDAEETEESFGEIQLPNHQLGCILYIFRPCWPNGLRR